jgi:hypothetical protein
MGRGIPLQSNPLMEMRDDAKWFSLRTSKEIVFFSAATAAIAGYFIGWMFVFKNRYGGLRRGLNNEVSAFFVAKSLPTFFDVRKS